MSEIYISIDIEADGPIPGPHSMLSLGAVAFDHQGKVMDKILVNFETLEGASPDPDTKEFWDKNPDAYNATRENTVHPAVGMKQFHSWLTKQNGKPVVVGYPITFDFLFVYWYLIKFVGHSPFSHSGLDIKTLAMAKMGTEYRHSTKRNMPKHWFRNLPRHSHRADDDALEQGMLFFNILKDR